MMTEKEWFSPEELSILLEAIDRTSLVGCPEISNCILTPEKTSEKAVPRLRAKRLLDNENHLTENGQQVLQYLEQYTSHSHYIFVNDCYMTFNGENGLGLLVNELGILLMQRTRNQLLDELYISNPILQRELEIEGAVHREIRSVEEQEEILTTGQLQFFGIGTITTNQKNNQQFQESLYFLKEDTLYVFYPETKQLMETTQGLLNKKVVDTLGIAYEKATSWFS